MRRLFLLTLLAVLATAVVAWRPAPPKATMLHVVRAAQCPDGDTRWAARATAEAACSRTRFVAIDPQGRRLWIRAWVNAPEAMTRGRNRLFLAGAASSTIYVNGAQIGANGQPGDTAVAERVGRYMTGVDLPAGLLRTGPNLIALHVSSQNGIVPLQRPLQVLAVVHEPPPGLTDVRDLAALFIAGGVSIGAAFFFAMRALTAPADRASWLLSALMLSALGEFAAETLRLWWRYDYPIHGLRLSAVCLFAVCFSICLSGYAAQRFAPAWRNRLMAAAGVFGLAAVLVFRAFDTRAVAILVVGVIATAAAVAPAAWRDAPRARIALAALAAFAAGLALSPSGFVDVGLFRIVALFGLALLAEQVVGARTPETPVRMEENDRMVLASLRGEEVVPVDEVLAFVGADDYVEAWLADGRRLLQRKRLRQLADSPPKGFVKVHRSAIVNLKHVTALVKRGAGGYQIELSSGESAPVSRANLSAVRAALAAA